MALGWGNLATTELRKAQSDNSRSQLHDWAEACRLWVLAGKFCLNVDYWATGG